MNGNIPDRPSYKDGALTKVADSAGSPECSSFTEFIKLTEEKNQPALLNFVHASMYDFIGLHVFLCLFLFQPWGNCDL